VRRVFQIDRPDFQKIGRELAEKYTLSAFVGPEWLAESIGLELENIWYRATRAEHDRCEKILKARGGFKDEQPASDGKGE
jgi:hypothetical protein